MCVHGQGELDSFLIQISTEILAFKDPNGDGFLVDKILDKTGMKGTGESFCLSGIRATSDALP